MSAWFYWIVYRLIILLSSSMMSFDTFQPVDQYPETVGFVGHCHLLSPSIRLSPRLVRVQRYIKLFSVTRVASTQAHKESQLETKWDLDLVVSLDFGTDNAHDNIYIYIYIYITYVAGILKCLALWWNGKSMQATCMWSYLVLLWSVFILFCCLLYMFVSLIRKVSSTVLPSHSAVGPALCAARDARWLKVTLLCWCQQVFGWWLKPHVAGGKSHFYVPPPADNGT